jgi:Thioesterase superfamily
MGNMQTALSQMYALGQANRDHGGWLGAFLDMQMPFTALGSDFARGKLLTTVDLSVQYLVMPKEGHWVEGRARVIRCSSEFIWMTGFVMMPHLARYSVAVLDEFVQYRAGLCPPD